MTDARKTRWATLRPEVRKAYGIAAGSPRQRFPSDPRPRQWRDMTNQRERAGGEEVAVKKPDHKPPKKPA